GARLDGRILRAVRRRGHPRNRDRRNKPDDAQHHDHFEQRERPTVSSRIGWARSHHASSSIVHSGAHPDDHTGSTQFSDLNTVQVHRLGRPLTTNSPPHPPNSEGAPCPNTPSNK